MKKKTSASRPAPRRRAPQKFEQKFAQYCVRRSKGGVLWVSTDKSMDRDGEVVVPDGVDLSHFLKNPVLLWGHDHSKVIGSVRDYKVGKDRNTFTPEFSEASEDAKTVKGLVEEGHLRATSIGFLPRKAGEAIYEDQFGPTWTAWELIEQSIVAVPSNRNALMEQAKRFKSVARIADWFGMPEVERVATQSGLVRGFRFEKLEDVLSFAEAHQKRQRELELTKQAEGQFKGTTKSAGDGDGHSHSFLVSIEDGEVTIGQTDEAPGHSHRIRTIGVTEPGGEDGHVHEWALAPEDEEEGDEEDEVPVGAERSARGAEKRVPKASASGDDDDDGEDDEDLDDDEGDAADGDDDDDDDEDEGEPEFDLDDDDALDELIGEVLDEVT